MILCNFNFKMADEPSLLGLEDGTMSENDDKICGWSTNKIGGTPVSLLIHQRFFLRDNSRGLLALLNFFRCPDNIIIENNALSYYFSQNWLAGPPSTYPSCSLCKRILYLVSQIYCPLSDSLFHRVLYIFGCSNPACWSKSQR